MAQKNFGDNGRLRTTERRTHQILVVDDRQALWTEIALLLAETDASVTILTVEESARTLRIIRPRLLVVGEESRVHLDVRSDELLQLIISQEVPAGQVVRAREGRNVVRLGWPADKEYVLELIGRMLTAAKRYPARMPVSVTSRWEEGGVSSMSEDLSVSGMSFRSPTLLEVHDEISIELDSNKGGADLCLDGRVVRCSYDPDGGPSLYGVRFHRLSDNLRTALRRFVGNLLESRVLDPCRCPCAAPLHRKIMCEFCMNHGDGKVWYRNAKNYADDLASDLRRRRFIAGFFQSTMEEGVSALGRLETIYRKKKRLPAKLARAVEERAREEHFGQVVTIEDVRAIVGGAQKVVCLPCACRWAADRKEKRRCFSVSYSARPWFEDFDMSWFGEPPVAGLQEVGKDEALTLMEELEKEGAVHTIWTMITPFIGAICNCTPRECLGLRNLAVGLETMFPGEERAVVDPILCSGCGLCLEACHFDAIGMEASGGGEKARTAAAKCYGCGLCRPACPEKAISMVERGRM